MKLQRQELRNFYRYETVRRSGKYNMITEADEAAEEANMGIVEYLNVIRRYSQYSKAIIEQFGSIDTFMKENKWK